MSTTVLATDIAMPNIHAPPVENAPGVAESVADRGDDDHLKQRAGNGDAADLPEVAEREVQADAEHQQDHAELGELADRARIAAEPGVNGPSATPATR